MISEGVGDSERPVFKNREDSRVVLAAGYSGGPLYNIRFIPGKRMQLRDRGIYITLGVGVGGTHGPLGISNTKKKTSSITQYYKYQ